MGTLSDSQKASLKHKLQISNERAEKRKTDKFNNAGRLSSKISENTKKSVNACRELIKNIKKEENYKNLAQKCHVEIDLQNTETVKKIKDTAGKISDTPGVAERTASLTEELEYRKSDATCKSPADRAGEELLGTLVSEEIEIIKKVCYDATTFAYNQVGEEKKGTSEALRAEKRNSWVFKFKHLQEERNVSDAQSLYDAMLVIARTSDGFREKNDIFFRSDFFGKLPNHFNTTLQDLEGNSSGLECHHFILNSHGGSHKVQNLFYLRKSEDGLLHWVLELERFSLGKVGTSANPRAASSCLKDIADDCKEIIESKKETRKT